MYQRSIDIDTVEKENPTIVFNTPGSYDVQLIVSDGSSIDTVLKTNYIVVSTFNPIACVHLYTHNFIL